MPLGKRTARVKRTALKKLWSVEWAACHRCSTLTLNLFQHATALRVSRTFGRHRVAAGNHRLGDWRRQTLLPCLKFWEKYKIKQLKSGGSVSSGPLPLINHSNYLPQPQECAGRAAPWPLPRWEAVWGLWSQHQCKPADVYVFKKDNFIYKDARNQMNNFLFTVKNCPLLSHLPLWPVGFIYILEFI